MRPALFIVVLAWVGCHANAATSNPAPPPSPPATLPHGHVTLHTKTGPASFDVELALDSPSHERGLMFRKEVASGTGMLFVFRDEIPRVFWMKNTLVPLDMLFLSSSGKVVAILENAEPLTLTARDSKVPAKYVLEIAGGTAFSTGIHVGDQADFDGIP